MKIFINIIRYHLHIQEKHLQNKRGFPIIVRKTSLLSQSKRNYHQVLIL